MTAQVINAAQRFLDRAQTADKARARAAIQIVVLADARADIAAPVPSWDAVDGVWR
jgi:lipopolysaccharide biosynthesis regulator YciM